MGLRPARPETLGLALPAPSHGPGAGRAERAFVVGALLVLAQALVLFLPGGSDGTSMGPLAQALLLGVFGVTGVLLSRHRQEAAAIVSRLDVWAVLLIGFACASVTWSASPQDTLRSLVTLAGTTAFGVYLAVRFSLTEQLRLLGVALVIAMALSVVLIVAAPAYGTQVIGGDVAWRGAFTTKNVFGRAMALTTLVLLLVATTRERPRIALALAGTSAILAMQSVSAFALISLGATGSVVLIASILRLRHRFTGPILLAILVASLGAGIYAVGDLVGRDPTLTGRTMLWDAALEAIADEPVLGHGYGAFWRGWEEPSAMAVLRNAWNPPHAHNGALDLALEIGVVGLSLWVLSVGAVVRRSYRHLRRAGTLAALWPLALVVFIVGWGLSESTGPGLYLFWALFVAVDIRTGDVEPVGAASR
jgi:O-antigen ligase